VNVIIRATCNQCETVLTTIEYPVSYLELTTNYECDLTVRDPDAGRRDPDDEICLTLVTLKLCKECIGGGKACAH
jgi:hypothetical protein